jgi:hypothetical protein
LRFNKFRCASGVAARAEASRTMSDQTAIDRVTKRLAQALDQLDAAVDRKIEIDRSRRILTEQVHALDADRSRLAADLDLQLARVRQLETVNRDIARRLDAAMGSIQLVLDAQEP